MQMALTSRLAQPSIGIIREMDGQNFDGNVRSSLVSRARYTSRLPPVPSGD